MADDRILVQRASGGDDLARSSLYERHLPAFRAFVRLRMGELLRAKESTTDIVQSVFREVLEGVDDFEWKGEAAFRQWLFQRGTGKILNRHKYYKAAKRDAAREAHKEPAGLSEEESLLAGCYAQACMPSKLAMNREDLGQVEKAFDALPEDYRHAILLSRIVGLSTTEIAQEMGRTAIAVRTLLSRALARLVGEVARHGGLS